MPAAKFDLKEDYRIEQGATWWFNLQWKDTAGEIRDLSDGWSAKMQIRETAKSDTALLTATSEEDGGITLDTGAEDTPNISIKLTSAMTEKLSIERCMYDIELTEELSGDVYRVIEGNVNVKLSITR